MLMSGLSGGVNTGVTMRTQIGEPLTEAVSPPISH